MKKATTSTDAVTKEMAFEASRKVLERAFDLNTLNSDHSANLGRLYYGWANATKDRTIRKARLRKAQTAQS